MKFNVINLGCKVNAYEAESTAAALEARGYTRCSEDEAADFSVIYTCAVTNMAAQKSRKILHRLKRQNPDGFIVAAGCYSQIEADAMQEAAILAGTGHKEEIPDLVEQYIRERKRITVVDPVDEAIPFENMPLDRFESQTRAYLKIQDGCNQFCSYCVIPYARGRERSMAPQEVLDTAVRLSEKHREIVLAGIHTGRYGREYGLTLADLLEKLLAVLPADFRIRISSIEMTEVDSHLISLMKQDSRIARHLHIPLQSGCDATLQRMHRPYTTDEYLQRIKEIRAEIPGISLSTDLIVGFQGETPEEFADTAAFLKKCAFSFLHVFPFSLRSGTEAEHIPGTVHPQEKKERVKICTDLSGQLYDSYKSGMIGASVSVLIEKNEGGYAFGHTSEYLPVYCRGNAAEGTFINARINELKDHTLYAERITEYETE